MDAEQTNKQTCATAAAAAVAQTKSVMDGPSGEEYKTVRVSNDDMGKAPSNH